MLKPTSNTSVKANSSLIESIMTELADSA
jgi:hypothetical protein